MAARLLTVLFGLLAATEAAPVDAAEAAVADRLVGDGLADGQPSRDPLFSSAPSEGELIEELAEEDAGYNFSPSIDTNGDNLVSYSEALKFLATEMPNSCWFLTDSPNYKDNLKHLFRATGTVAEASYHEPFFTYEQAVNYALGLLTSSDSDVVIRMSALFECMGASSATGISIAQGRRRLLIRGVASAASETKDKQDNAAAKQEELAELQEQIDNDGLLAAMLTTMAGAGNYLKTSLVAGAKLGKKYFLSAPYQEVSSDFNKCFNPKPHPYFTGLDDPTCSPKYTPPPDEVNEQSGGTKNNDPCSKDGECRSGNCKAPPGKFDKKTCRPCDPICKQTKKMQKKLAKNRACAGDLIRNTIIKQDGIERFRYCCKNANGGGGRMFPEDGSGPLELCVAKRLDPSSRPDYCETKIMRQENCEMLTEEEIQELFTAEKIQEIRDSDDPQSQLPLLWKTPEGEECPEFKRDEAKVETREVYADSDPVYEPDGTNNIVDGTGWYAGGPKCLGEVKEVCPCKFSDPQGGENELYVKVEDDACQLGDGKKCTEDWMCASEDCQTDGTCSAPPADEVPSSVKEKKQAALQKRMNQVRDQMATMLGRSKFGTSCADKCIQGFEPPEEKSLRESVALAQESMAFLFLKSDKSLAEVIGEQIAKIAKEHAEELVKDPTFADYEEWGRCCSTYAGLGGSVRGNRVPGKEGYQRAVLEPGDAQCMHTPKGGTQKKGCGELSICEVDSRQCKGGEKKDEPGYKGPAGGPMCKGLQKDVCAAGKAGFGVDGGSCGHCATPLAATCVGPFGEEKKSACTDGCLYNEMCMHPAGSDKRSGELAGTTAHLVMPGGKEQCVANAEHSGAHSTPPWLRYVWCAPEPEQAVSCSPIQEEKYKRCLDSAAFSQGDAPKAGPCPVGYGMMTEGGFVAPEERALKENWECRNGDEFNKLTDPVDYTFMQDCALNPSCWDCDECEDYTRGEARCNENDECYGKAPKDKGWSYICKEGNCEVYDDA